MMKHLVRILLSNIEETKSFLVDTSTRKGPTGVRLRPDMTAAQTLHNIEAEEKRGVMGRKFKLML